MPRSGPRAASSDERNILSVADRSFASPWIQRPLELGFDIAVQSTTTYLNGHSDVSGGIVVISGEACDAALAGKQAILNNAIGSIAVPLHSNFALRGVKMLDRRMQRHCDNPLELAG